MQTIERCIKQMEGICPECRFDNLKTNNNGEIYSESNSKCRKPGYEPFTYELRIKS